MIDHRVLSVVVVDAEHRPKATFGLRHVISFMLKIFKEEDFGPSFYMNMMSWMTDAPHTLRADTFSKSPLSTVFKQVDMESDPLHVISGESTLLEAVKLMIDKKAHRIVVCDKDGKVSNLITQSRIISLLNLMEGPLDSIENLKIGSTNVIRVTQKEVAFKAFKLIDEKRVNGLAVVNEEGQLVGNFSISDIKLIGWNADYWNLLGFQIKEYLQQLANHPKSVIRDYNFWTIDRPQNVVLKCKPSDSLSSVIRMMCFFRVHRVYVVDTKMRPNSVISMHDIIVRASSFHRPVSSGG
jgi:CBS domain-containing protein